MSDLRERVADAMWDELRFADDRSMFDAAAPVVLAIVIESLAAEAESHLSGQQPVGGMYGFQWAHTVGFLRRHLDAGRDGEAS